MRGTLVALASLLTSAAILYVGGGLNGVLIPVRANLDGFPTLAIGLLGTGAAIGMILGCILTPRLIQRVGHIRVFAVLAAGAAIVAMVQGLIVDPVVWVLLRIPVGLCFAGLATVIESWLNAGAGNRQRGRLMAIYMAIQLGMQTSGQLLLMFGDPATFVLFAVAALAITTSLIPVGLTQALVPGVVARVHFRPLRLYRLSPSGVVGALVVGLVIGPFWALGPLYAHTLRLDASGIAIFMSAAVVSGALLQYPLGRLSDRMDRRTVLIGTASVAMLAGFCLALFAGDIPLGPLIFVCLFGAFMFALYPLCVAHVNDFVPEGEFVEVCSGLLLLQGIGSMLGPLLATGVMALTDASGLFLYTALVHGLFIAFVLLRLIRHPHEQAADRDEFIVMPSQAPAGLDLDPRAELEA